MRGCHYFLPSTVCLGLPLLLYVSSLWADSYMLLITLFVSRFTGLLVTFAALYNTIIFTYRFSSNIAASLLKTTVGDLLYSSVTRRRQLF